MSNHVTSIIRAPSEVISAFIHNFGPASFENIVPFQGNVKLSFYGKQLLSIYREYVSFSNQSLETQTFYYKKEAALYKKLLKLVSLEEQQVIREICSKNYNFKKIEKFLQENPGKDYRAKVFGDWYSWNIRNWNSRSDCYDVYVDYDQVGFAELSFNTAWSPPIRIFIALSMMFPDTLINVAYADESSSLSCSLLTFLDGCCVFDDNPNEFTVNGSCYYSGYGNKWANLWLNIKRYRVVSFEDPKFQEHCPPPQLHGLFNI